MWCGVVLFYLRLHLACASALLSTNLFFVWLDGWIGWCFLFAVYVAAHTSHTYHHHHIMAISMNLEYNIKADTHIFCRFEKIYGAVSDIRFRQHSSRAPARWQLTSLNYCLV